MGEDIIQNLQGRITKAAEGDPAFRVGDKVKLRSDSNSPTGKVTAVTKSPHAEGVYVFTVKWPNNQPAQVYDAHDLVKA